MEQLVRTKKVSIHQSATEHSKVMESMHGSITARGMSVKTTASATGQRKRGKTLPGNLAERPTGESLTLPPMKVEPIDITLPFTSPRKNTVNSNSAKNLMDAPTRIPIAVMKPTVAKSSTSPEKKKSTSELRNKGPAVSSSALTSKTKSANNVSVSGHSTSNDSLKTTSIPKTIRGGGQIPVARKQHVQNLIDSDDIQCTTSMSTPKSFSRSQKAATTVGSQSSRTDQQAMKEHSKDALKYTTRSKIRAKSNTSNSDSSFVSKSTTSEGSKRLTHSSRRPSLTGTDLVQDQMLREKDKATKLKADYVSAHGLITLSEDINKKDSETAVSKRTKRRSMQTLSLHERLQNLVTEGKPAEHNQKQDWDTQSTGSSATDDSEIRALGHLSTLSSRVRKTGQDRTSQLAKDRPLRLAMGPQAALKLYMSHLSPYEKAEILEFSQVYFVGSQSKKHNGNIEQTACNYGYDDDRGDYRVVNQDHLAYRYEILEIMGKGSFGQVLKCFDHRTGNILAIKIIRNKKRFHAQALVEVKILEKLMKWDSDDKHNNVRMTHHFYFRNHLCIAFECLSINLYEFIKSNDFKGFSLSLIRRFCIQLLNSLSLLYKHKVVHCDLKPENVLLKHPSKSYIKVIDFGSSCMENEKVYTYIQSRFYRSPEVILGLAYNTAIDMWSLGCILAELFTGYPLFPGENEQDQLACIMEVQGVPDQYLVEKSTRKKLFFDSYGNPRIVPNSKGKKRRPGSKTLAQALKCTDELFIDFVSQCLEWDSEKRLNPEQGLAHQWIAGGDDGSAIKSSNAQSSISTRSTLKI
ncbi:serine/threonine protein kinase, CMGC, dual-specificity [Umbelopsis sp. WA50703]